MTVEYTEKKYIDTETHRNTRGGFSLLELMITVAIFSFIVVIINSFYRDLLVYNRVVSDSLTASFEGDKTLQIFAAELRSAMPSRVGSYPLIETATNSITFYADNNNDGNPEEIKYYVQNNQFKKRIIAPQGNPPAYQVNTAQNTTLITNLLSTTTPIFAYYDDTFTGQSATTSLAYPVDPRLVRMVRVQLLIDRDKFRAPEPLFLTVFVVPRNLKDNL